MEIQCMLKMTSSGKRQQQHQHLEEAPEGILRDQIPAPDPTKNEGRVTLPTQGTGTKYQIKVLKSHKFIFEYE